MANLDATMPGPVASPLIGRRPSPWFNVLAGVIVVTGIYTQESTCGRLVGRPRYVRCRRIYQLMAGNTGTSGVDWSQAAKIGESLLFSPLIGFSAAAL